MLRQFLLFPHAPPLLATQARRPMQFRLLMELENGFISYLLLHQRSLPDADDIALIAPTLTEAIHEDMRSPTSAICHDYGEFARDEAVEAFLPGIRVSAQRLRCPL